MKKSELERRMKALGCYLAGHGKRHYKWVNAKTGVFEYVPRHADEVATGIASKILKRLAGKLFRPTLPLLFGKMIVLQRIKKEL